MRSVGDRSHLIVRCAGGSAWNGLGCSNWSGFGWQHIDVWKLGVQWVHHF
ncbi:MAG: hypothetical protein ACREX6_00090 [Casimicrobiaceae bacterium]